ncbi:MAG: hypothetical protein KAK00_11050, partial [Nanoarchaeota archaeon]|nr:hypothetical protein [Nanoarchaeota archaeon]
FRINNLQFSVDNYDYVRNRIAAENGGSVDNYLNSAVGQCLERQQHSIQIWKEIGNLCKDILYP